MNRILLKTLNFFGWTTKEDKVSSQIDGMEQLLSEQGAEKLLWFMQTPEFKELQARYFTPEFVGPGAPHHGKFIVFLNKMQAQLERELPGLKSLHKVAKGSGIYTYDINE